MTLAAFVGMAIGLKEIKRAGWVHKLSIKDGESVADHSYLTAIISMILSDAAHLDSERVIKMALLHDLAESKTGDIMPDQMPRRKKKRIEDKAFAKIVSVLPAGLRSEYLAVWAELCAGVTPEARIVRQADKIEMALQSITYQKTGRSTSKDIEPFLDSAKSDMVDDIALDLLSDIITSGKNGTGCE